MVTIPPIKMVKLGDDADGTVLPTFIKPRDFFLLTHHLIYGVDNHY